MVKRPVGFGAFEFSVIAGLRAAQLARGCTPRIEGVFKRATLAQMEVAQRLVCRLPLPLDIPAGD